MNHMGVVLSRNRYARNGCGGFVVRSEVVAMTQQIIRVTDETTAAELAECLAILNAEAKAISRRGHYGTDTAEYRVQHERIDAVLGELLAKTCA